MQKIVNKIYKDNPIAQSFLLKHSLAVSNMSCKIAERVGGVDVEFVREAALIHDIGIIFTHAPDLNCFGDAPYIKHGIIGERLLTDLGFPRHARVCRTHVGVAITKEMIQEAKLPLPYEDMIPITQEEIIVAYADKFFSKSPQWIDRVKPLDVVVDSIKAHSRVSADIFMEWHNLYGEL